MKNNLIIGIVGHTNTGKTSLIRTLLRNSQFGDVRDEAGTTRHVESVEIIIDDSSTIELRDTPGMEDSNALRAYLDALTQKGHHNRECLAECIANSQSTPEFEQEIKVLKQTLQCNILLYVIDCREPIFEKYINEIHILRLAAIPILPVLNFIHAPNSTITSWQNTLAELGLHAQVAFDTVAFDFQAEKRLYQKLQTLIEAHYSTLQKLLEKRESDWRQLQHVACLRVAHLFIDVCKFSVNEPLGESKNEQLSEMQSAVRTLEQTCLKNILALMQFNEHDVSLTQLPVTKGQWQLDLFSAETLKTLGLDTATAAATGAAVGVGVDLLFAGLSLGAATAAGAAIGAAWHTGRRFGKNFVNTLSGNKISQVDDTTLDILLLRQLWLLNTLFHRGHATNQTAELKNKPNINLPKDWPTQRQSLRTSAAGWGAKEDETIKHFSTWFLQQIQAH